MTSINTNQSAMIALDTLRGINKSLSTLNDQISTGKKVNNARDNASVWAISTTMESDVMSLKSVQESLSLGSATVGVARNASESITTLLKDAKSLISQAQQENVDRTKIQTDLDNIATQVQDIVDSAQFNGLNLLKGSESINILSSFNRNSSSVEAGRITVERQNLDVSSLSLDDVATVDAGASGRYTAVAAANRVTLAADIDGTGATAAYTVTPDTTGINTGSTLGGSETIDSGGGTFSVSFGATSDISAGDTIDISFTLAGETEARSFTYVAQSDSTTASDVINGLADQLSSLTGFTVARSTSSADGAASLTVTNNTGAQIEGGLAVRQFNDSVAPDVSTPGSLNGLDNLDVTTNEGAAEALTQIDQFIETAINAAASFGSAQKRIDTQTDFITSLVDSLKLGVGALTDADLTEASAELSALQVQQQLGLQSLSIANSAPQSILALFQ